MGAYLVRHFNMSGHEVTQSDTTQLVLEMSDADIDVAVRFCDDVLSAPTLMLLPPTLEFGAVNPGSCFSSWKHRTVTYPVARIETPDVPALFVKIEIPSKGVWDVSVVTASDVCVARWSQKAPAKSWKPPPPHLWSGAESTSARWQWSLMVIKGGDACHRGMPFTRKGHRKTSCSPKTSTTRETT